MTILRSSNKRRAVAATAAVVAAVATMSACSAGSGTTAGDLDLSSSAPTGVTITMWHSSADSPALLKLYKAWEKESGNKISFVDLPSDTAPTVVQTKWATGERPDVLEYSPTPQDMAQLNMSENMIDLSSMAFSKDRLISDTLGVIDGKTYGAVLGPVQVFGEFFNKDVLAKAGISAPTNAAELTAACTKIKAAEPGVTPVSIGGGSQWPAMMLPGFAYMGDYNANNAWGEAVAAGTTKVSDPNGPIASGLKLVSSLRSAGCLNSDVATETFNQAESAVVKGTAAMTFLPSDELPDFYAAAGGEDAVNATVGFGAFSATKGVPSYAPSSFGSYFAPKTGDTTKERAAADFINWVATSGYQQYVSDAKSVPTLSTASSSSLTGLAGEVAKLQQAKDAVPAFNLSVPGFGNFGTLAQQALVGQLTPEAAAAKFQTFIDQAIQAQQ